MKKQLLFVWLALAAFAALDALGYVTPGPAVNAGGQDTGWINMSEGADPTKSKYWTTEGNWSLADGVFTLKPRPGEKGWQRWNHYLWSNKNYGDFEIKFDYKIGKGGNSGFFFRVDEKKKLIEAAKYGLEVQIFDSFGSKKLSDHTSGGLIPGIPPLQNAAKPIEDWNAMHVIVKDDKLTVILNDVKVQDQLDLTKGVLGQRPKTGPIGFQDEALPIMVRNIRLQDLTK